MPDHIKLFIKALLLLAGVALCERLLFMAWNSELAAAMSASDVAHVAVWGLRFDLAIATFLVLLVHLLAYLAHRLLRLDFQWVFARLVMIALCLLVIMHGGDIMYFADSGRHPGYEALDLYNDAYELVTMAATKYTGILLIELLLLPVGLLIAHRVLKRKDERKIFSSKRDVPLGKELQLVAVLLLSVLLVRGGVQSAPLEPIHAQNIGDSKKAMLALNGAYNALFFSVTRDQVNPISFPLESHVDTGAVIRSMYSVAPVPTPAMEGPPVKQYNIVMVLLESWSAVHMQSYGGERNVTPFFDTLRKNSLTTTHAIIAGGHRTTEGMFATLCSAQNPLGQTVAQSQLQNFSYRCLPGLLREDNYSTAFFQGTSKNTSGTGAFAQLLGFADSYGKADIRERQYETNHWGVHDPDIYRFALNKIRAMPQPFFVGINTNSTHDEQLPKGVTPAFDVVNSADKDSNVMNFADQSLADFMAAVTQESYFRDTIFVLVADHAAHVRSSQYNSNAIPFLIYAPHIIAPHVVARAVSQRDIAPTVLDILDRLDRPETAHFTGKTLLRDDNAPYFADYYEKGIVGWIEDDLLIEIPLTSPQMTRCYHYRNDPLQMLPQTCTPGIEAMKKRALVFTSTAQSLLFAGRLQTFNRYQNGSVAQAPLAP